MKLYTDISQSKKLAEILPLESADGYWFKGFPCQPYMVYTRVTPNPGEHIPCWSLAALLDVIPKRIKDYNVLRIDISENDFAIWYDEVGFGVNNDLPDITADNPIDACYEMILKLNELKLL